MVRRFPTTLAVFLRLNHKTSLALNNTIKLCASTGHKEFVNVHKLSTKQPEGVDVDQGCMWFDRIKKAVWRNRTTTDAVVLDSCCKVAPWEAAAPIDFCAPRSLCTHNEDITHPTVFTTAVPFTMLRMGCPQPSFRNSYSIATHPIPNAPITTDEGFMAVGYCHYFLAISPITWLRLQPLTTWELPPE